MKTLPKTVKVVEVPNEGLVSLMGKQVEIRGVVYIMAGTLIGVNDECIKLDNAAIVYETGEHTSKSYKDAQRTENPQQYFMKSAIESFGESSKKY